LDEKAQVFMIFASLKVEGETRYGDLPVVNEFPNVFPKEITDIPPEGEVEFAIDLVPGTSLVLTAPYKISSLELG